VERWWISHVVNSACNLLYTWNDAFEVGFLHRNCQICPWTWLMRGERNHRVASQQKKVLCQKNQPSPFFLTNCHFFLSNILQRSNFQETEQVGSSGVPSYLYLWNDQLVSLLNYPSEFFRNFPQSLHEMPAYFLKSDYDRSIPHISHYIDHPIVLRYWHRR
jgi:hypothetical protein